MAGVVHIPWYATILRHEQLAKDVAVVAPLAMRYGATKYAVHHNRDDRYKVLQMAWFESKDDWYRYWDGPEMIEFRRRNSSRYQIPLSYIWHEEIAAGELEPEVAVELAPEPEPEPEPHLAG